MIYRTFEPSTNLKQSKEKYILFLFEKYKCQRCRPTFKSFVLTIASNAEKILKILSHVNKLFP